MVDDDNDQRSYFRIKDELMLRWELARADELTTTELDEELGEVNDQIGGMINAAYGDSPVLAEALGLLNRKIDLLVEKRRNVHHTLHMVKVNLSGAGVGFAWERSAPADQVVDVTMRLQPSNLEVTMRTKILYCDPIIGDEKPGFWIRGEFLEGQDMGVEQIVRHVSFRQTQRLAAKRRQEDIYDDDSDEWYEDVDDD